MLSDIFFVIPQTRLRDLGFPLRLLLYCASSDAKNVSDLHKREGKLPRVDFNYFCYLLCLNHMLRAILLAPLLAGITAQFAPGDSQSDSGDSTVGAAAFAPLLEGWPNEPTRYPQGCVNSARYPLDSFVYATRVLGRVTVRITGGAGRRPTDILVLGACDGAIRVSGSGSQSLLIAASGIVAGASPAAFTACLRAIRFQSTAPVGEEGLGRRIITFHAETPDGRFEDTDEKPVEIIPATPENCPQQFAPLLEGMLGRVSHRANHMLTRSHH